MKKRIISIVLALIMIAVLIIYLGNNRRISENNSGLIEFSALLPLTGPLSSIGDDERIGMTLALEDISSNNNQKISFGFYDSQGKGNVAVSIIQKQWNINKDRFFITTTTGPTLSTLPIFDDYDESKIVITQTMYPEVTQNHPYAFRLFPSSSQEARMLANYAIRTGNNAYDDPKFWKAYNNLHNHEPRDTYKLAIELARLLQKKEGKEDVNAIQILLLGSGCGTVELPLLAELATYLKNSRFIVHAFDKSELALKIFQEAISNKKEQGDKWQDSDDLSGHT